MKTDPPPSPFVETLRDIGGLSLQVAEAGPPDGPLTILLHGFPDVWQGWRGQIGPLADLGLRVLAPNQRGYGESSKPHGASSYELDLLVDDVVKLAESEGRSTFRVVGHDWGGVVAWRAAARYPDRVERAAILNAPHPGVMKRFLWKRPAQIFRSSYIGFFQIPKLPEAFLRTNDFQMLFAMLDWGGQPGSFDERDRAWLRQAWSQPGALTGMLNWYRALRSRSQAFEPTRVRAPILLLWGERDPALDRGLGKASLELCDCGRAMWFENAKHWVQRDETAAVNSALVGFLSQRLP